MSVSSGDVTLMGRVEFMCKVAEDELAKDPPAHALAAQAYYRAFEYSGSADERLAVLVTQHAYEATVQLDVDSAEYAKALNYCVDMTGKCAKLSNVCRLTHLVLIVRGAQGNVERADAIVQIVDIARGTDSAHQVAGDVFFAAGGTPLSKTTAVWGTMDQSTLRTCARAIANNIDAQVERLPVDKMPTMQLDWTVLLRLFTQYTDLTPDDEEFIQRRLHQLADVHGFFLASVDCRLFVVMCNMAISLADKMSAVDDPVCVDDKTTLERLEPLVWAAVKADKYLCGIRDAKFPIACVRPSVFDAGFAHFTKTGRPEFSALLLKDCRGWACPRSLVQQRHLVEMNATEDKSDEKRALVVAVRDAGIELTYDAFEQWWSEEIDLGDAHPGKTQEEIDLLGKTETFFHAFVFSRLYSGLDDTDETKARCEQILADADAADSSHSMKIMATAASAVLRALDEGIDPRDNIDITGAGT